MSPHGVRVDGPLEDTVVRIEAIISDITKGYGLEDCCIRHRVTPKKGDECICRARPSFPVVCLTVSKWETFGNSKETGQVVDYTTGDGGSNSRAVGFQQRLGEDGLRKPWQLECDLLPYW